MMVLKTQSLTKKLPDIQVDCHISSDPRRVVFSNMWFGDLAQVSVSLRPPRTGARSNVFSGVQISTSNKLAKHFARISCISHYSLRNMSNA